MHKIRMGSIINFIKKSLTELRENVRWTPRSELLNLAGLVIVFSVLFAFAIWVADQVLEPFFNLIS